ncbi:TPA: hypothetical protein ACPXFP_002208, partial [Streptococcus pneumoniae]
MSASRGISPGIELSDDGYLVEWRPSRATALRQQPQNSSCGKLVQPAATTFLKQLAKQRCNRTCQARVVLRLALG